MRNGRSCDGQRKSEINRGGEELATMARPWRLEIDRDKNGDNGSRLTKTRRRLEGLRHDREEIKTLNLAGRQKIRLRGSGTQHTFGKSDARIGYATHPSGHENRVPSGGSLL